MTVQQDELGMIPLLPLLWWLLGGTAAAVTAYGAVKTVQIANQAQKDAKVLGAKVNKAGTVFLWGTAAYLAYRAFKQV